MHDKIFSFYGIPYDVYATREETAKLLINEMVIWARMFTRAVTLYQIMFF